MCESTSSLKRFKPTKTERLGYAATVAQCSSSITVGNSVSFQQQPCPRDRPYQVRRKRPGGVCNSWSGESGVGGQWHVSQGYSSSIVCDS